MRYNPHILHHVFPILTTLLAAITSILFPGWQTILALIVVAIISVMISFQIVHASKMQNEEYYWSQVGEDIKLLSKSEPEIWEALGFRSPPEYARIEIDRVEKTSDGKKNPYYTTKYANVPVSPATLQLFADGILSGRKKLSEGYWKGIIPGPKYRDFQDWMDDKKLIAKVNPQAATQGYILTESGEDWLLQFASQSVSGGVGGEGYMRKIPVRSDTEVARDHTPI